MRGKRRKLAPSTRILYLRRDLKSTRSMLEWASRIFSETARAMDNGQTVSASDLREASSQCQQWASRCDGW